MPRRTCAICEKGFLKGFHVAIGTIEGGTVTDTLVMDYCPTCAPVGAEQFKLQVESQLRKIRG